MARSSKWQARTAARIARDHLCDLMAVSTRDPSLDVVDDTTGVVSLGMVQGWQGLGRVSIARPGRRFTLGDDRISEATHRIRLPLGAGVVSTGDVITLLRSDGNPDLDGAEFTVIGLVDVSERVTRQVYAIRQQDDPGR